MPTKKTTRTARPSRGSPDRRSTTRPPSNVIHMHEHLAAIGQGNTRRCQRLRLLVDIAHSVGANVDREDLDRVMVSGLLALPA